MCCWLILSIAVLGQSADERVRSDAESVLRTFRAEFIKLTPGQQGQPAQFRFGTADGSRDITLHTDFEISRYEVTQQLWQTVMGTNPSRWKGRRNSVEMVTFDDALRFCQQVTLELRRLHLIDAEQEVTLPDEVQWEYAARGGSDTVYSFGDQAAELGKYAWFTENAAGNDPPVGAKLPNAWGLYDVHGYLWEWCQGDAERGPVLRGGSWKSPAAECTSTARRQADRQLRADDVGLRCVIVRETAP